MMKMLRVRAGRAALFCAVGIALLVAASAGWGSSKGNAVPKPVAPVSLKVMVFNIEDGGTQVSFAKVVQAIKKSGADVAGIEEACGHIPRLARLLGWPYFDTRLQIVSRYPLVDPPGGNGVYTFVQLAPGRVVAMENVHLPSAPYGPNWVRNGKTRAQVLALERRVRLPAIQDQLAALPGLAAADIPVFLTGDFNSPSYRDWTEATVGTRKYVRYAVKWPVSVAVEAAGFRDSFREVYPNPVKTPGLTWWAPRPHVSGWNPGPRDPQDRIDFVYAAGAATATASRIVGEKSNPAVKVSVTPWPSDHRAVVSTFSVTPATPPVLVAVDQRLVAVGQDLKVTFHSPGATGEQVAIVPAGGDPAAAIAEQTTGAGSPADGTLTFATAGFAPGAYETLLLDGSDAVLAHIPFWVKAPGAKPQIATDKHIYNVDEPIQVTWQDAPGNRWDWVGIYKAGADPNVAWYILWLYTNASIDGSATFDKHAWGGGWPLPPGKYSLYLLRDDAYHTLATATFRVRR